MLGDREAVFGLRQLGLRLQQLDFSLSHGALLVDRVDLEDQGVLLDLLADVVRELDDLAGGLALDLDIEVGNDAPGAGDGLENVTFSDGDASCGRLRGGGLGEVRLINVEAATTQCGQQYQGDQFAHDMAPAGRQFCCDRHRVLRGKPTSGSVFILCQKRAVGEFIPAARRAGTF